MDSEYSSNYKDSQFKKLNQLGLMLCCGSVKRVFVSVLKFIFFTERLTEKDITVKFSVPQIFFCKNLMGCF